MEEAAKRSSLLEYSRWACLPRDVLYLILEKLRSISDYIRCGAVCKHWRSIANFHKKKQQQRLKSCHKQLPLLMIPSTSTRDDENLYALHNVTQGKTYNHKLQTNYQRSFCGCSHGWLAYSVNLKKLEITLLNPLTGRSIWLPPVIDRCNRSVYTFGSGSVANVVLSADPCLFPNDYEALAIYITDEDFSQRRKAAHFRSGNHVWTHIDVGYNPDIIYYQKLRKFLLANCETGDVVSVNVNSDPEALFCNKIYLGKLAPEISRGKSEEHFSNYSIVESSRGDLLLIRKVSRTLFNGPISFEVFKLWSDGLFWSWVEIASIGSDALFLGDHTNMSVSASDFPECRPNSIYLIDASQNVVVFNLENGKQETHSFPCKDANRSPIWIVPTMV